MAKICCLVFHKRVSKFIYYSSYTVTWKSYMAMFYIRWDISMYHTSHTHTQPPLELMRLAAESMRCAEWDCNIEQHEWLKLLINL